MCQRESDAKLGEEMLRIEAEDAMKDVLYAVEAASLSSVLPASNQQVYINLTTKEGERYCVEFSIPGFRIVGREFDRIQSEDSFSQFYETIYALLDSISPEYRRSFGETLMSKLSELQTERSAGDGS